MDRHLKSPRRAQLVVVRISPLMVVHLPDREQMLVEVVTGS